MRACMFVVVVLMIVLVRVRVCVYVRARVRACARVCRVFNVGPAPSVQRQH